MRSSYIENGYGELLEEYVSCPTWQPSSAVELGVLDGYSTLHIARGIRNLDTLRHFAPKFDAYDLFDDYEYKHGNMEEVRKMLDENGVGQYVNLVKGDAYKVHENYPDVIYDEQGTPGRGIEFLHIDISNTGKVIKDIMELWHPKLGGRCIVAIEGGSSERDEVEWMKKYNMPSIKKEIETNEIINKYYIYGTYFKFPSLTVMLRKWYKVA